MQVGVPGHHQGGASGISKVSSDSDMVPVLSLWPLTKVSDYTEASCYLLRSTDPRDLFKKYFS